MYWVGVMSWEAKKYHGYARECARLAEQAETVEKRNKLLELARVWLDAAIIEEQGLLPKLGRSRKSPSAGDTRECGCPAACCASVVTALGRELG